MLKTKISSVLRQEFVICADDELFCFSSFGCNKCGVVEKKPIHLVCKLKSHSRGGDSFDCISVVTFSYGSLLLPAR